MKKEKLDYDGLTAIVVILFGMLYLTMSLKLPKASIGNAMDPIYFPLGLSIMLLVIGALLLIKSDKSHIDRIFKGMKHQTEKEKQVTKMVSFTCAIAIIYGLIFEHVGFVLATFFFMMSILYMTNGKKHLTNVLVSGIFSLGIFALFNYALGIPLPGLPFM
ncbi:MAG: tripartite tricarboxylate transporter TctB family protein [Clostridia bacterium]|nr:tripartite tricarboxylate transporter TctB family protein [Clostridia bacterium]